MNTQNVIATTADEQLSTVPNTAAPAGRWSSRARESFRRFDRYTLEVMNPGHPYRVSTD
jgi:hypothetical protein